jgi:hypothetical protein
MIVEKQRPREIRESLAPSHADVQAGGQLADNPKAAAGIRNGENPAKDLGWWALLRYWFDEFIWRRRYWRSLIVRAREGEQEGRQP